MPSLFVSSPSGWNHTRSNSLAGFRKSWGESKGERRGPNKLVRGEKVSFSHSKVKFRLQPFQLTKDLTKHIRAEVKKKAVRPSLEHVLALRTARSRSSLDLFANVRPLVRKSKEGRAQRPKRTSVGGRRRTAEHCLSCLFVFEVLTCDKERRQR